MSKTLGLLVRNHNERLVFLPTDFPIKSVSWLPVESQSSLSSRSLPEFILDLSWEFSRAAEG